MMLRPRLVRTSEEVVRWPALVAVALMLLVADAVADPGPITAEARTDSVRVALVASGTQFAAGDTITVELEVPEAGLQFNAYDAYVEYDPGALTFLRADDLSDQEGPLMREACNQTFHVFDVASDSTYLEIHHSLLCSGTYLTGPGVIYRLRFLCRDVDTDTTLRLLRGSPTETRFFANGLFVTPLRTTDVQIRIGAGDVTATPPDAPRLELSAAPNPFNPRTTLRFELVSSASVDLRIYDLAGRHVRRLASGLHAAGEHRVLWDGCDRRGREVPSGVYLVRLRAGEWTATERLTLVR